MVDGLTEILPYGSCQATERRDSVATDAGAPAAPAGDRRAGADNDRSWDAAISEGWPSSPPHHSR